MKVLYFDCFSGISGDMTLGALLDLGIDRDAFIKELQKLNLEGYRLEIGTRIRNGIVGTDVNVILEDVPGETDEHSHEHDHHHDGHDHQHDGHDHHHDGYDQHDDHDNEHAHEHLDHGHKHTHGRNLTDIEYIIDSSLLTMNVKTFAKKVFREIAAAEAKVHNKDISEVHFHEVGAIDSIVDIVGAAICLDMLGAERIYSSPLHDGKGFIECQHGTIPVPVPAVMEMLRGSNIPLIQTDVNTELVTPTGMGIIKSAAAAFGKMPPMTVEKTGYGMGKRDTGSFNALRVVLGSLYEKDNSSLEEISVLETNIDNMSPEILGYTFEKLMDNGALDVFHTPIYMKKNRPAVILTVMTRGEDEKKLVDILLRETGTLGVRKSVCMRYALKRELVNMDTPYGKVRVKVASGEGIRKAAPEYEDCREIAEREGIALADVYNVLNGLICGIIDER